MKYFYFSEGNIQGPILVDNLVSLITPDTLIWASDGSMKNWKPAKEISSVANLFLQTKKTLPQPIQKTSTPPPIPIQKTSPPPPIPIQKTSTPPPPPIQKTSPPPPPPIQKTSTPPPIPIQKTSTPPPIPIQKTSTPPIQKTSPPIIPSIENSRQLNSNSIEKSKIIDSKSIHNSNESMSKSKGSGGILTIVFLLILLGGFLYLFTGNKNTYIEKPYIKKESRKKVDKTDNDNNSSIAPIYQQCINCLGEGKLKTTCDNCDGKGYFIFNSITGIHTDCSPCIDGKIEEKCPSCEGKGRVRSN
jgi:hypothetical protein